MLYSETSYPDAMTELPEEVRSIAIKTANEMLLDGDVRHHEDLIVLIAIEKAKEQLKEKSDRN
jgi:uncharacterized protein YdaT